METTRAAPASPEAALGLPANDHRTMLNGILWVLHTGAPWRDLPERYGPWVSVYSRFRRWKEACVWDRLLAELQAQGDLQGELDWEIHYVGGTIVRAHHHATGAKNPRSQALGRSHGGFSTKIHIRAEGQGKPITFLLTPGQPHEITQVEQLLCQGAGRQPKGRPRIRPKRVVCDMGYSFPVYRRFLRRKGIRLTIPRKKNQSRMGPFDKEVFQQRNRVERLINRLKQFLRVATRYDKRGSSYAAMLTIAVIRIWL